MPDTNKSVYLYNENDEIILPKTHTTLVYDNDGKDVETRLNELELKPATVSELGGVKIGDTLTIDSNGILNSKLSYIESDESADMHPNYQTVSDSNLNTTDKTIVGAINELFQSVNNGKNALETAIIDAGGTVSKSGTIATFQELIDALSTINNMTVNYDDTTGDLSIAGKNVTYNDTTGDLSIAGKNVTYNDTTGDLDINN